MSNNTKNYIMIALSFPCWVGMFLVQEVRGGGSPIVAERFDHEMHVEKVFKPLKVSCSQCHHFHLAADSKTIVPDEGLAKSTFRAPFKQMCHECHRSEEPRYHAAVKTCYTCHSSEAELSAVKPQNHKSVAWKTSHALEARVSGGECLNCHMTSQCVKCHTQRNDIRMRNHTRNFRYTHSVQARMQPQRCDACHTKTFCIDCHVGRK